MPASQSRQRVGWQAIAFFSASFAVYCVPNVRLHDDEDTTDDSMPGGASFGGDGGSGGASGVSGDGGNGGSNSGNGGSGADATGGESTEGGTAGGGGSSGAGSGPTGGDGGNGGQGGTNATGGSGGSGGCTGSVTFEYNGSMFQGFSPLPCITQVTIEAFGAEGGAAFNRSGTNPVGGKGAYIKATVPVTPSDFVLYVFVGGRGQDGQLLESEGRNGGWNGGGDGGFLEDASEPPQWTGAAGGGGGASDVRMGGNSVLERVVVAAGGGGAGNTCTNDNAVRPAGGHGGGINGVNGGLCYAFTQSVGGGGTQVAGGAGGNYDSCSSQDGDLAFGGNTCGFAGGGGGGGYYGGGAGAFGGGGGGSSFVVAGATGVVRQTGVHSGNGRVIISW